MLENYEFTSNPKKYFSCFNKYDAKMTTTGIQLTGDSDSTKHLPVFTVCPVPGLKVASKNLNIFYTPLLGLPWKTYMFRDWVLLASALKLL